MPRPYFYNKDEKLAEIARVNHAGEYGARQIYKGQIRFTKDPNEIKLLQEMLDEEQKHLDFFNDYIKSNNIRPTILLPVWDKLGFILGALSSIVSPRLAMLLTEKVEDVIEEHYAEQINFLKSHIPEEKIIPTLELFRLQELEHRDIAIKYGSNEAPLLYLSSILIHYFCKIAINASKKI